MESRSSIDISANMFVSCDRHLRYYGGDDDDNGIRDCKPFP